MNRLLIRNFTNNNIIASNAFLANTFFLRFKGLLGKSSLEEGEGLIIKPCNSVHSFGMKFSIDVLFISNDHKVLKAAKDFKPNKISPRIKGASYVIEVPVGIIESTDTKEEDVVQINIR